MANQINNLSSKQFENSSINVAGVTLVYKSTNKSEETHESAVIFAGDDYTPANTKQDEIFRIWKNIVTTFWDVKRALAGFKVDNSGISSKLRFSTPASIIVRSSDGKTKRWDIENLVWSRIGLVPSKKDLEECKKDFKKKVHKAAKASFDALSFRVQFAKEETKDEKIKAIA